MKTPLSFYLAAAVAGTLGTFACSDDGGKNPRDVTAAGGSAGQTQVGNAGSSSGGQGGSIGVGFAIPINQAKRVAEELERTGRATRAVLGVALATSDRTANGAAIGQVTPGGPAEQAGLRAGEVVTRVDDRLVTNGNELVAAIRDHAPGDRVTLTVDERQVDVTLGGQTG